MPTSGIYALMRLRGWRRSRWCAGSRTSSTSVSCVTLLVGKQRRLPFPKGAKYRVGDVLELIHGNLCGPTTPARHEERRYFLLLVDDCSRFMWLQLLVSKDEAAVAIRRFQDQVEVESGKKLRVLRGPIVEASSLRWNSRSTVPIVAWCASSPCPTRCSRMGLLSVWRGA